MAPPSVSRETLARGLSGAQRRRLDAVLAALASDEHAPTTIREPDRAAELHLADSLSALELDVLQDAGRIVDLGSGAGFPGVPLAVALPDADVTLVESQRRRCEFLERLCTAAGIENVHIAWTRAEAWSEGRSRHDVALARALASQSVVLEYAAPLLRVGGKLIDWRGRRSPSRSEQPTAQRRRSACGAWRCAASSRSLEPATITCTCSRSCTRRPLAFREGRGSRASAR